MSSRICIPREIMAEEGRVAAFPESVAHYVRMGFDVAVEAGAGHAAQQSDEAYAAAGARIVADAASLFGDADVVLKVKQPILNPTLGRHEVELMREGAVLITFLHPAAPSNHGLVRMLRDRNITAFTMDGIPREESHAQKMDALTSMSTVTGYKSVVIAADHFPKFIPMIGTSIGTITQAKFLIVGAGVVGLQAIATAKRLGGAVVAVDVREDARKAAVSLGVKVPGFEVPEALARGEGGYAKALPDEWLEREREFLRPLLSDADIVISSALVPGEVAPVLIDDSMLRAMKPGSVLVDVAIDQGGNCAATEGGRSIERDGVWICGRQNIPGSMPVHASWLYEKNMREFVSNLFKKGIAAPDLQDAIAARCLVTHAREIRHRGALGAMRAA